MFLVLSAVSAQNNNERLPVHPELRAACETAGLTQFQITHALRCYAQKPTAKQYTACSAHLQSEIAHYAPKYIVTFGRHAAQSVRGGPCVAVPKAGAYVAVPGATLVTLADISEYETVSGTETLVRVLAQVQKDRTVRPTLGIILSTAQAFQDLLAHYEATPTQVVAFDYETTSLSPWTGTVLSIGVSQSTGVGYSIAHTPEVATVWTKFLRSKVLKAAHNAAFEGIWSIVHFKTYPKALVWDTQIGAKFLNENESASLKTQVYTYTDMPIYDSEVAAKVRAGDAAAVQPDVLLQYNAADADATLRLMQVQQKAGASVDLMLSTLGYIEVLCRVRARGVLLDVSRLPAATEQVTVLLAESLAALNEFSIVRGLTLAQGKPFNPASPAQVARLLFQYGGMTPLFFSKRTRLPSTGVSYLRAIAPRFPVAVELLEFRRLSQIRKNFLLPLAEQHVDGVIHPEWKVGGTATWRIACSGPNLQNIPRGEEVRSLFVPHEGCVYIAADYNQIELRVLAALAREPVLLKAFAANEDPHRATAAMLYDIPLSVVSDAQRDMGKRLNFGAVYGISEHGLYEKFGIPKEDGVRLLDSFWKKLPAVRKYIGKQHKAYADVGTVQSIFGRVRRLSGQFPDSEKRQAGNFPIQSAAAEITLKAMVELAAVLPKSASIVGQIHDSILLEVERAAVPEVTEMLISVMEAQKKYLTGVALKVSVKTGEDWYHMGEYDAEATISSSEEDDDFTES